MSAPGNGVMGRGDLRQRVEQPNLGIGGIQRQQIKVGVVGGYALGEHADDAVPIQAGGAGCLRVRELLVADQIIGVVQSQQRAEVDSYGHGDGFQVAPLDQISTRNLQVKTHPHFVEFCTFCPKSALNSSAQAGQPAKRLNASPTACAAGCAMRGHILGHRAQHQPRRQIRLHRPCAGRRPTRHFGKVPS